MFSLLLAGALAVLDVRLKDSIEAQPPEIFPVSLAGGRIILRRHHNTGAFLNAGGKHPGAVRRITAGLFAVLALWLVTRLSRSERSLLTAGLAFVTGGSVSNLQDRFRRGYVVDYFSLPFKKIRHIVWNLGDLSILGGTFLSIAALLFSHKGKI